MRILAAMVVLLALSGCIGADDFKTGGRFGPDSEPVMIGKEALTLAMRNRETLAGGDGGERTATIIGILGALGVAWAGRSAAKSAHERISKQKRERRNGSGNA